MALEIGNESRIFGRIFEEGQKSLGVRPLLGKSFEGGAGHFAPQVRVAAPFPIVARFFPAKVDGGQYLRLQAILRAEKLGEHPAAVTL